MTKLCLTFVCIRLRWHKACAFDLGFCNVGSKTQPIKKMKNFYHSAYLLAHVVRSFRWFQNVKKNQIIRLDASYNRALVLYLVFGTSKCRYEFEVPYLCQCKQYGVILSSNSTMGYYKSSMSTRKVCLTTVK